MKGGRGGGKETCPKKTVAKRRQMKERLKACSPESSNKDIHWGGSGVARKEMMGLGR